MQPIAGPWDSPKEVTVNSVPRVLPDMGVSLFAFAGRSAAERHARTARGIT
jgi:hypothetical protein